MPPNLMLTQFVSSCPATRDIGRWRFPPFNVSLSNGQIDGGDCSIFFYRLGHYCHSLACAINHMTVIFTLIMPLA